MSPTSRCLGELKKRGHIAQVVERRIPRINVTVDLFGVIDLVYLVAGTRRPRCECETRHGQGGCPHEAYATVIRNGVRIAVCDRCDLTTDAETQVLPAYEPAIVGVQACSGTDHARRRDKILAEPRALQWIQSGGRLEIWSWAKQGARGKRKLWTLRLETITADMFATQERAA